MRIVYLYLSIYVMYMNVDWNLSTPVMYIRSVDWYLNTFTMHMRIVYWYNSASVMCIRM